MNSKYLAFAFAFIFLIGIVGASTETYKVNTPVNLILTCTINNAIPSASATMNITIAYPNGTLLVDNQPATAKGSGIFNYTLTFPIIGTYHPTLLCIDGSNSYSDSSSSYQVTPDGFTGTLGFFFLILILSIGIIVLGYYVQDAWIVILGSFSLVLVGLFILFYGLDGLKDPVYTWGIGIIILMLGGYFGIKGSLEKLENEL